MIVFPMTAYADYGSWIDKESKGYKKVYGSVETEDYIEKKTGNPKPFEQMLADLIVSVGDAVYSFLASGNIKLTLDSIVTGRMAEGVDVSFTLFDLHEGNPYGIIGSTIYVTLRRIAMVLYVLIFVIMLAGHMIFNSSKDMKALKDLVKSIIFFYILFYTMPLIVDQFIYIRDVILYEVMKDLGNLSSSFLETSTSGNIYLMDQLRKSFTGSRTIFNSFLYVASVLASFFFFAQYVTIALLLMILYAIFPFVCLYTVKKRELFETWRSFFIPNLFVPLLDGILLLVPALIYNVYTYLFGVSNDAAAVVVYVIELIAIWSIIPIRNEILKLFGYNGIRMAKSGISGVAIMLAAKMMKGDRTAPENESNDSKKEENPHASMQKAEDQQKLNDIMNNADQELQLPDLNDQMERQDDLSSNPYESETDELLNEMNNDSLSSESGEATELDNDDYPDMMDEPMSNDGEDMMDSSPSEMGDNATMNDKLPTDNESKESDNPGKAVDSGDETAINENKALEAPVNKRELSNQEAHMDTKSSVDDEAAMKTDNSMDSKPIRVPSYNYDYEFKDSLSERDQKRYENLAQKDALSSVMAENDQKLDNMEYQRGKYTENRQRLQSDNRSLDRQIEKISEQKNSPTVNEKITQLNNQKVENQRQIDALERGHEIERQNNFYQAHMRNCEAMEAAYARNSGLGGMSTRAYESAAEFRRQKEVEQVHKKHATFKNFDSRQFEGMISPLEKEAFYRQRARDNIRQQSIHTAATVGKVIVGGSGVILGATANTYGGANAMINAAVGGAVIGSGISKSAGRAVERLTDKTGVKEEKSVDTKRKKPEGKPGQYTGKVNTPKRDKTPEYNVRSNDGSRQKKQETEQSKSKRIIDDFNKKADRFEAGSKT